MSSPKASTQVANSQNLGFFTTPSFITIGDTYDKKEKSGDRYKGKQFQTSPPKKGKVGQNVSFGSFMPLFEKDEKYQDPGTAEKKHAKDEKKKQIVEKPFRVSSPPKRSTGLGDNFGSIGKPYEYIPAHDPNKKEEPKTKSTKEPQKKNILTNPPKKGTYGFAKVAIGPDYNYQTDPFDGTREKEMKERKENSEKIIGKAAFKATAKPLDFFDTQPNVASSKVYTMDKPMPEVKKKEAAVVKNVTEKPFKPSSPPKGGYNSTFTKFPEYKHDPYDVKLSAEDAKKAKEQRAANQSTKPVWKSMSVPKSSPTKSIVFGRASAN